MMTMQPNPQAFGYRLLLPLHAVWPLTLGGRCQPLRLSLEARRAHLDRHLPLVALQPGAELVVGLRAVRVVHECQAATVGAVVDAPAHTQVPVVAALPLPVYSPRDHQEPGPRLASQVPCLDAEPRPGHQMLRHHCHPRQRFALLVVEPRLGGIRQERKYDEQNPRLPVPCSRDTCIA